MTPQTRQRLVRTALGAFSILVVLWLIAPTTIVIPLSFTDKASLQFPPTGYSLRWYERFFSDPRWTGSLLTSLRIAIIVALLAATIGTAAAIALHRSKTKLSNVIQGFILMPAIVPVVIVGAGTYLVYLNLGLIGTTTGFVFAHTVLAVPLVVVAVTASLSGFDQTFEAAAASLGASRLTIYRTVTLPLIAPGVIAGLLFAFITSFDEVMIALFIASPATQTLPVLLYNSVTRDTDPTIAAVATLVLVGTTALFVLVTSAVAARSRRRTQKLTEEGT